MHKQVFDQIVIGVGGMGSAAVCALARRGHRVLGLEQFGVPHEFGSSAASTRIFRFAYFEDPSYVPLMRLAFERWQQLQREFGQTFVSTTGGLDIGLPSGRVVQGAKLACQAHGLAHQVLRGTEVSRRFPAWQLPAEFEAVLQPEAGFLLADRAIEAHVTVARRLGAEVHEHESVRHWRAIGDRVEVETERACYEAGALILTAGAWTGKLLARLKPLAVPERQVVGWFKTDERRLATQNFPVFILDCPENGNFYGIPEEAQQRFKVGKFHHRCEAVDPDRIDRQIVPEDIAVLNSLSRYLAQPLGTPLACKTCMFVNSPDEHFIIDALPEHPHVIVAAGFSGHGYKFCAAIGEILADLSSNGTTPHDTHLFRLSRAALNQPSPDAAGARDGAGLARR
jgi:sarcosine oxidase